MGGCVSGPGGTLACRRARRRRRSRGRFSGTRVDRGRGRRRGDGRRRSGFGMCCGRFGNLNRGTNCRRRSVRWSRPRRHMRCRPCRCRGRRWLRRRVHWLRRWWGRRNLHNACIERERAGGAWIIRQAAQKKADEGRPQRDREDASRQGPRTACVKQPDDPHDTHDATGGHAGPR